MVSDLMHTPHWESRDGVMCGQTKCRIIHCRLHLDPGVPLVLQFNRTQVLTCLKDPRVQSKGLQSMQTNKAVRLKLFEKVKDFATFTIYLTTIIICSECRI